MKLKEILKLIEANQKIIINHGPFAEEYKGLKKHINPAKTELLERDVHVIYTDHDIYNQDCIKIRISKGGKHESD